MVASPPTEGIVPLSGDIAPRIEQWRAVFCAPLLLQSASASPEVARSLRLATADLDLSQQILFNIVHGCGADFEKELNRHGALYACAWEGFRLGALSVVLTAHGNYAAGDMATRAMLETTLTGACMDRLVHTLADGRPRGILEPFDRIGRHLRAWAGDEGMAFRELDAASLLAMEGVGKDWDDRVRFEDLLVQLEAFHLTIPFRRGPFREYVNYGVLSGVAHGSPVRTELFKRIDSGAGGPFAFEPVFLPAEATEALNRLRRCVDGGLLVDLNALAGGVLARPESRSALAPFRTAVGGRPEILPEARRVVDRILRGQGPGGRRSP